MYDVAMRLLASFVALASVCSVVCAQTKGAPSDVPKDHWAYKAVDDLFRWGLLDGYPNGTFDGSRPATRYEMAALMDKVFTDTRDRLSSIKLTYHGEPEELTALRVQLEGLRAQVGAIKPEKADLDALNSSMARLRSALDQLRRSTADLRQSIEQVAPGH